MFCRLLFVLLSCFVTRLTRRVPLVEQELLTLQEHLSSPPVFSRVRVTRSLVLCACFVDHCLPFCSLFLLLYVLLRNTDYDYSLLWHSFYIRPFDHMSMTLSPFVLCGEISGHLKKDIQWVIAHLFFICTR